MDETVDLTEVELATLHDVSNSAGGVEERVAHLIATRLAAQRETIAAAIETFDNRTVIIAKADAARLARTVASAR